ncbi:hypothetical protein NKJ55_26445 [Mesorhizobium sp. M0106]|uniref:hypothetical protein n=1 Tax=Mesorhizobium sp. M0106 TaxID=2956880 RepID=UPI003336610F
MKSWNDRLNTLGINGITPSPRTIGDVVEGQPMLVPTARQVHAFIRSIPEGMDMNIRALRTALAIEHGAEMTCPVTIGYHLRTVAEAANEDLERGMALGDVAPFWRVVDASTPTTKKLSFGAAFVAQRKREGLER